RAQEQAGATNLPLPASLESLVSQRLERVPARAREGLLAASILRRPSRRLLEAIAEAGTRAVDEAVASGVLQEEGDRFQFAHPLLASALPGRHYAHDRRKC